MKFFRQTADKIFKKRKNLIFILFFILSFLTVYNFLYPACGEGGNWLPPSAYLPKFSAESSDNILVGKIYPIVSENYRLNSDVGSYLELGKDFNKETIKNNVFLNRPLYSFLVFLISSVAGIIIEPSYGIVFAASILLNMILLFFGVIFFFLLVEKLFSSKIAIISSLLLIFSPFVRSSLVQPMPEMLSIFMISVTGFLIYNYIKNPSPGKLIIFSLIAGVFMLAKMFYAIAFFVLFLAFFFRRYKDGAIFLFVHLIPPVLWYLWVTRVWQMPYFILEVQNWDMGVWIFKIFRWPWFKTGDILLSALPNFITAIVYGFILLPLVFSVLGFWQWRERYKNVIYFGPFLSIFLLCFAMNLYLYRHVFLLFPVIYPTAVLGIEAAAQFLKKYKSWFYPLFYCLSLGLVLIFSNINFYKIFDYLKSQ